jgi:hypothetical protein
MILEDGFGVFLVHFGDGEDGRVLCFDVMAKAVL